MTSRRNHRQEITGLDLGGIDRRGGGVARGGADADGGVAVAWCLRRFDSSRLNGDRRCGSLGQSRLIRRTHAAERRLIASGSRDGGSIPPRSIAYRVLRWAECVIPLGE
jgi:hypothetical protein